MSIPKVNNQEIPENLSVESNYFYFFLKKIKFI
jgi:hypothetical protein